MLCQQNQTADPSSLRSNRLITKALPFIASISSGRPDIVRMGMSPDLRHIHSDHSSQTHHGEFILQYSIKIGIDFCKQKKIILITLGYGYKNKKTMEEQYRHAIQFIDHFEQPPKAVEKLFQWTFLYGSRQSFSISSRITPDGKGA